MSPKKRSIVDVDWSDHLSCSPIGEQLVQQIPGSSFGRALTINSDLQKDLRARLRGKVCPYCGETLKRPVVHDNLAAAARVTSVFYTYLEICEVCGFWRREFGDSLTGTVWTLPYTRSFQPESHVPALRALAEQISNSPDRLYSLSPTSFELFVGTVLRDFMDCEVKHVGGTSDRGVDLLVIDGEPPLLVQVKRRSRPDSHEGVEVVKNMFASLYAAGQSRGMVVTSANRFTRGARAWVRNPVLVRDSFTLDLVDVNRLIDMTRRSIPAVESAWQKALTLLDTVAVTNIEMRLTHEQVGDNFVVESDEGSFIFARPDRDCCRFISTDDKQSQTPGAAEDSLIRLWPTVDSFAFGDLLSGWPPEVVDAIMDFWSGPARELLIEYDA
jgi:hypothetical protein